MEKFRREKTKSFKTKNKAGLSNPKAGDKKNDKPRITIDTKLDDEPGSGEPPEIVQLLHLKDDEPKRPYLVNPRDETETNTGEEYGTGKYIPMAAMAEIYNPLLKMANDYSPAPAKQSMLERIDAEMDLLFYTI